MSDQEYFGSIERRMARLEDRLTALENQLSFSPQSEETPDPCTHGGPRTIWARDSLLTCDRCQRVGRRLDNGGIDWDAFATGPKAEPCPPLVEAQPAETPEPCKHESYHDGELRGDENVYCDACDVFGRRTPDGIEWFQWSEKEILTPEPSQPQSPSTEQHTAPESKLVEEFLSWLDAQILTLNISTPPLHAIKPEQLIMESAKATLTVLATKHGLLSEKD